MDVILKQTIAKVGHVGDVVRVSDGYARNFLIPRGLAAPATQSNRKHHEGLTRVMAKKADEAQFEAEALQRKLHGGRVKLEGRTAPNSTKLFGAITTTNITDAIKEQLHIEVDKRTLGLLHPIKSAGEFPVTLHLHRGVDAEITVEVVPTEA